MAHELSEEYIKGVQTLWEEAVEKWLTKHEMSAAKKKKFNDLFDKTVSHAVKTLEGKLLTVEQSHSNRAERIEIMKKELDEIQARLASHRNLPDEIKQAVTPSFPEPSTESTAKLPPSSIDDQVDQCIAAQTAVLKRIGTLRTSIQATMDKSEKRIYPALQQLQQPLTSIDTELQRDMPQSKPVPVAPVVVEKKEEDAGGPIRHRLAHDARHRPY